LLLVATFIVAIRTDPGHSDYLRDLVILVVLFLLPVTASLYGLWKTRADDSPRLSGTREMPTTT